MPLDLQDGPMLLWQILLSFQEMEITLAQAMMIYSDYIPHISIQPKAQQMRLHHYLQEHNSHN